MPFDIKAASAPQPVANWPRIVIDAPVDQDGYKIPTQWQNSPNWAKLAREVRAKWSAQWIEIETDRERDAKIIAEKKPAKKGQVVTKYTTQYAIDWCLRQKKRSGLRWSIIDRERYYAPHRPGMKGHHRDLMLALDVLADDGRPGMVGIQAAGLGERAPHCQRFCEWGGVELAERRAVRVLYLVFERGDKTPRYDLSEVWAGEFDFSECEP